MTDRSTMLEVNSRQRDFYESVRRRKSFVGASSSAATSLWSALRNRVWSFSRELGIRESAAELHPAHLGDIASARVLDLGCGTGSDNSMWLAKNALAYTGIDLSPVAIEEMNGKLRLNQLNAARAVAGDILANDFKPASFDVVYAMSVLHHFQSLEVILKECARLLRPGGLLLSLDPLKTEALNRFARALYRPFQADREWEWPFDGDAFSCIQREFDVVGIRALLGSSRAGLPLYLIPGLGSLGLRVARAGDRKDATIRAIHDRRLRHCWQLALVLRRT